MKFWRIDKRFNMVKVFFNFGQKYNMYKKMREFEKITKKVEKS